MSESEGINRSLFQNIVLGKFKITSSEEVGSKLNTFDTFPFSNTYKDESEAAEDIDILYGNEFLSAYNSALDEYKTT